MVATEEYQPEDKYMKQGREAQKAELDLKDNPYDPLEQSFKHTQWEAGWDNQFYEDMINDSNQENE